MFQRVREMASGSLCLSLLKPSRLLGRMKDRLSHSAQRFVWAAKQEPGKAALGARIASLTQLICAY